MINRRLFLRFLGVIFGMSFIVASFWFLVNPIFEGYKETLSNISGVLIGLMFLFYGVTGYSSLNEFKNRNRNK